MPLIRLWTWILERLDYEATYELHRMTPRLALLVLLFAFFLLGFQTYLFGSAPTH
jgi:hypothetical protein